MFQTLSALFNIAGLASGVAGELADHLIVERRIRRQIEELQSQRKTWLWLTLAMWVFTLVVFVLPTLGSYYGWSDGDAAYLILPALLSVKAISSWTKNGQKIRDLRSMLGE